MKKSQVKRLIMGMIINDVAIGLGGGMSGYHPEETVVIQRDNT